MTWWAVCIPRVFEILWSYKPFHNIFIYSSDACTAKQNSSFLANSDLIINVANKEKQTFVRESIVSNKKSSMNSIDYLTLQKLIDPIHQRQQKCYFHQKLDAHLILSRFREQSYPKNQMKGCELSEF